MKQDKSFLAEKCLLYKDNLDGIIQGKLRPPIEVNLDPANTCNLNCFFCNSKRVKTGEIMPTETLKKVLKDIADWGVKGVCFAGGGEPSLHPDLPKAIDYCAELGLETAIITNGYKWSDELIEAMVKNMRWIGVSVDAGLPETFRETKGVEGLWQTIDNIAKACVKRINLRSEVGITFKFLIHPLNENEIYLACKIAKETGCDAIHLRPVSFLAYQDKEEQLDVEEIKKQVENAKRDFEDESFSVIPFFANFEKNLKRKIIPKCRLTPLLGICTPSGWWACINRKGHKGLWLCELDEIRKFWGSKKHLELLDKINPPKDCGQCTLAKYYPYLESYEKDEFFWRFV